MEKKIGKFSLIKYLGCFFSALFSFARYGVWTMHLYGEEEIMPAYIITRGKKFRVAKSLDHKPDEKVYLNAGYITYRCLKCGKIEHSWTDNYTKYVMENR